MVGGAAEDFAAAKPILDVVGKTVVHVGPNGAGQTVKAANQLIVGANIQVLAEALVFLEAYGVDTEAAPRGARRRAGRVQGARPEEGEHGQPDVPTGIPDRPAPQGHGHRDLSGAGKQESCCRSGRSSRSSWPPPEPAATEAWTIPRCCGASNGCPAKTDRR